MANITIDHLPCEVLCDIFQYLSVHTLKEASLVCKRWNEIIFNSPFNKRFTLSIMASTKSPHFAPIQLFPYAYGDRRCRGRESKAEAMLKNVTQRSYANMTLYGDDLEKIAYHLSMLYECLSCPLLENLTVLKLVFSSEVSDAGLMTLLASLPKLSRLTSLIITTCNPNNSYGHMMPHMHLKSDTVRHLKMNVFVPEKLDLPSLRSLSVSWHLQEYIVNSASFDADQPEYMLDPEQLGSLEEFAFSNSPVSHFKRSFVNDFSKTNRPGYMLRFYRLLKGLKKLRLEEENTSEVIFQEICQSCLNLTDLSVRRLQAVDPTVLKHLTKLPHLRRFGVDNVVAPGPISLKGVQLPKLEWLRLGRGVYAYETFPVFGALKVLELADEYVASPNAIPPYVPNIVLLKLHMPSCFTDGDFEALLNACTHCTEVQLMYSVATSIVKTDKLTGTLLLKRDGDTYQIFSRTLCEHKQQFFWDF